MENTTLTISCKDLIAALNAYQNQNGVTIRYVYYMPNKTSMYYTLRTLNKSSISTSSNEILGLMGMENTEAIRYSYVIDIENLYVIVDGDSKMRHVDISLLVRSVKETDTLATIKRVHGERVGQDYVIAAFLRNEYNTEICLGVVRGFSESHDLVKIQLGGINYEVPPRNILSVFNVSMSGTTKVHNFS